MPDPLSMRDEGLPAPIMLPKVSATPDCCLIVSTRFCAPPGLAATPPSAASKAGTMAAIPVCVLLRSSPSAAAMRPIRSGVRNCMMDETRLVAMRQLLSSCWTWMLLLWDSEQAFQHIDRFLSDDRPQGSGQDSRVLPLRQLSCAAM